jgi:hypothetical protein
MDAYSRYQILNILQIRSKQLYRILLSIGVLRLIIVALALFYALAAVNMLAASASSGQTNSYALAAVWTAVLFVIHWRRVDKTFLKLYFNCYKMAFMAEYSILSTPLIICLTLHGWWLALLSVFAGVAAVALISRHDGSSVSRTFNTRLQKRIPRGMYEWQAGARKNLLLLSGIWLLGACLSFFVATVLVVIFIIGIIVADFYRTNEDWSMLLSFEKSASRLLLYKITCHALLWSAVNVPLIVLFCIFHSRLWYLPVIEIVMFIIIHTSMILTKYARYKPDSTDNTGGAISQSILFIVGLIPLTNPLLLIYTLYLYRKAYSNLQYILHDYN